MNKNNSIVFLHLSDLHISSKKDINDMHLSKIVDSLKCYKSISYNHIIIIISGDITCTGEKVQFANAYKLIGALITKLKKQFDDLSYNVFVVPGNHDVLHKSNLLNTQVLKDGLYSTFEISEHEKLVNFYMFSKLNKCFQNKEMYYDKKIVNINGFKIQINLINNAIFSNIDEYKGLLYIPNEKIDELSQKTNSDFVITVMHHAPDFYRDDIKNKFENKIVSNSSVLFYGHEHNNSYKRTSYNGSKDTVLQLCGCLCNNGIWDNSSYIVGVLNVDNLEYKHQKFIWNTTSKQYEHDEMKTEVIEKNKILNITEDFRKTLYTDFKEEYFVFPSIILHAQQPEDNIQIESLNSFLYEINKFQNIIVTGHSNLGKSTILKKLFLELNKNHIVIFCSPDIIFRQSKNKKQNIEKLIKELFKETYGDDNSVWQYFEQVDKNDCVFIFDDFDQIDGIDIKAFMKTLNLYFGTIILSTNQTIDFNPESIWDSDDDSIIKFEIKPPLGNKRKELIEAVVRTKSVDKSDYTISNIVAQINQLIKSQIKLIPPEPYFIVQVAENFLNNIGEAVNNSSVVFSKIFEANITYKIDYAIKSKHKNVTIELMYVLLERIAHHVHFQKAYPISRKEIDDIVIKYNNDYGNTLVTEDIISIAQKAKILISTKENSEMYRFNNKSVLAYFVAKEVINKYRETNDAKELQDIIDKCCINICTDILLFIIFQTDDISILKNIISSTTNIIASDKNWEEVDIPNNMPNFLKNYTPIEESDTTRISIQEEKKQLEKNEQKAEEEMLTEIKIKDIYDWDDSDIDKFSNRLIRMTSLLHILSKAFPCFEHKLKKNDKKQLIELLYQLPNGIFMFWAKPIDRAYNEFIDELKLHPYLDSKKHNKMTDIEINNKAREIFSIYALNLLLNLYYIPVINATGKNTNKFLSNTEYFDFTQKSTYRLQQLMLIEQITDNDEFVKKALKMQDEFEDIVSYVLLRWIVRHGIITRNDKRENIEKLESKFFSKSQKSFLIERTKNKSLKE